MREFKREIRFYENHFKDFYLKQPIAVRKKIDWTLLLLKTTRIVPEKFLRQPIQTEFGKCEFQQETEYSESSVFFDNGNLIILLSGFQKKTQKTPKNEIKKAERLKKEYYETTKSGS